MRIILLSIGVIFTALTASAQSFIEVGGGVSLPTGNWSKVSTATSMTSIQGTVDDPSGYAKTGGFFSVDGAWFFSKHFGVGLMFRYGTYNVKGIDSLSQGYEESFDVDQTSTTATHYTLWTVTPGLYFSLPLTKKLAFTAHALAGISHATTPQIVVGIEDGGVDDPPVIQHSASKTAFAADLGVGLRYSVIRCLALELRADYAYTKPDFTIANDGRNNNAGREVDHYDQSLAAVNFSLGVAYLFKHH
ncbi:MAG TPA: hypothetical protein VL547_15330 [Dinghuibacter sp.]|uniref:hypothetical protein n=1 Tax=Dinghuibacter sp. TaxID=2024697 RepID=UPI002B96D887|nr:hypothetical protein [Dinghuibacter sp.]HTJ13405.1 hypothetical protein [Dinghuibacter sp.]